MVDAADQYNTPYGYVGNNPISFIDPDGNWGENINWGVVYSGLKDVGLGALEVSAGVAVTGATSGIGAIAGGYLIADGGIKVAGGVSKIITGIFASSETSNLVDKAAPSGAFDLIGFMHDGFNNGGSGQSMAEHSDFRKTMRGADLLTGIVSGGAVSKAPNIIGKAKDAFGVTNIDKVLKSQTGFKVPSPNLNDVGNVIKDIDGLNSNIKTVEEVLQ